MVSPITVGG